MRTTIKSTLCAAALVTASWFVAQASDTVPATNTGKVLILDNERTLEGEIDRQGGQYRVRRSAGELWIQAENVLKLCQSREEAYDFLRLRANLRDPDEHMRLARWCHANGLRKQALDEVTAAVNLRPEHAESQRLLRSLQRAAATATTTVAQKPITESEPIPAAPPVNNETLSLFVTKVQPILMNACANCHATGRGGAFKLTRTTEGSGGGSRSTQQNLSAALNQLSRDRVQGIPLLTKSLSVHGDMTHPALKSREAAPYRALEDWVRVALETNPGLTTPTVITTAATPGAQTVFASAVKEPDTGKPVSLPPSPGTTVEKDLKEPLPVTTNAADPFDPLIYNRQMHPQAKGANPKQ